MAGHSAWKNIKHKKAANDARRGKAWSKCARLIIVAARTGGGDPASNLNLRYAIDDARAENMPRDTIEKAIKKGTGELQAESYESAIYEGYGPGGVAMMVEILTDNRHRTAPEVKRIFERHGGNLGGPGSVSYVFQTRGQIMVPKAGAPGGEDKLMELALDAGAEDVRDEGEYWQVLSEPGAFPGVRAAIEKAGIKFEEARITMVPNTTVRLAGEDAKRVVALVEALEDHDDVQKVHANFEISEADLAAMAKA
jgi:YebC/PmpR family DNA-binding regulatory protein